VPQDDGLWLAPADGKIVAVERIDDPGFVAGPALRIAIFMSIFDTHINRSPCDAKIEKITYRRGKFLNAMNPLAGKVNESNDLAMVRISSQEARASYLVSRISQEGDAAREQRDTSNEMRNTKFVVRQISGAIARRIVCAVREGEHLAAGEQFGMIKFGSRTELYIPADEPVECRVRIGDKVRAGVTPLARYVKPCTETK